jgi:GTP-binding protein
MTKSLRETRYLISETDPSRLKSCHAEVTFLGYSNVGKSSLICAVTENWKLARVSKLPGRTRAITVFEVMHGRWIIDLPGYGFAFGPKKERDYWPKMTVRYLGTRPSLRMIYVLIDAAQGAGEIDRQVVEQMKSTNFPWKIVATKVDKVKESQQAQRREQIAQELDVPADSILWVSAEKGINLKAFRRDVMTNLDL